MAKKDGGAPPARPNLTLVGDALDAATPAPKVGKDPAPEYYDEEIELPLLPPGCPVEPLGVMLQVHYYLDEQRQLIGLDPQKHGKTHILALFGRKSNLCNEFWPRFSDKSGDDGKPIITGWKPEVAAQTLMRACAMRGIFDPQGKVRGTGAHRGDNGELIIHCGDKIYITGPEDGYKDPGLIKGYVYPAGPSRPRPHQNKQDTAAAEILLMKLRAWHWARELVDPMLLLGWVGCALVGGALDWRPHAWITGSSATGKSTLQKLLRSIFDGAALTTGNATEAGLRQLLKQQTLPVLFDEIEAQEDNRKNTAVIELARLSSSGDQALKGGQDHQGHEFTVRSCFLFSSILLPPMPVQDKNRLAILELERIPPGKAAPAIDQAELRELGRKLRRRLVDQWHRVDELVGRYKTSLEGVGHSGRSGDQFGTLLAIADLLLYDEASEENINSWAGMLRAETLAEKVTEMADEEQIVQRLASSYLRQRGGDEPLPISRHIKQAVLPDGDQARARLENNGLRIVEKRESETVEDGKLVKKIGALEPQTGTPAKDLYLAVANAHTALDALFGDTRWSDGTWQQSFGRVDGAVRRVKVRYGGEKGRWSTLIPLTAILDFTPEKP